MRKLLYSTAVFFSLTVLISGGVAYAENTVDSADQYENRLKFDRLSASIKSTESLYTHISTVPESPINLLPSSVKWEFIASLKFGDEGISSLRYDILEGELSAKEIYEIFSLFGIQNLTSYASEAAVTDELDALALEIGANPTPNQTIVFADYDNYECVSEGTCGPRNGYICTSNC